MMVNCLVTCRRSINIIYYIKGMAQCHSFDLEYQQVIKSYMKYLALYENKAQDIHLCIQKKR